MTEPIKVYTEKDHGNIKYWRNFLIHPIRSYWGDGTLEWERWEEHFDFYKRYFVLSDKPQNADVAFLPFTLNYYSKRNKIDIFNNFVERMYEVGRKVFVWVEGDHDVTIYHPNCILIKYAGYKSNGNPNTIIQPGDLKDDLLNKYYNGKLQIRQKKDIPSVGFIGLADYNISKLLMVVVRESIKKFWYSYQKRVFKTGPIIPYSVYRKSTLEKIKNKEGIDSEFILRKSFAEGVRNNTFNARSAFISNIMNNDYTFCMRGGGNYSLRFYETLCLGRIPLFIDTDCVLPFEEDIDWKQLCLWIDINNIDRIGEIIIDFHSSITSKEFKDRQLYAREVWEKYLSKEGFANQLNHFISNTTLISKN